MDKSEFRKWSHRASDWTADYNDTLSQRPVRAQVKPGDIGKLIEAAPPDTAHDMETIFADFERIIPDGMTHWQHPRFFAYFPSNAAPAAVIAEQLATAIGAQCMLWQTSPAATELEVKMIDWLRQALGLPEGFSGTFQDTASSATLCAVLTMRERAMDWTGNKKGLFGQQPLRVYASKGTHSSIDKAMWVSGMGQDNLVHIPVDDNGAMDIGLLRAAIKADREAGYLPAGLVVCVGGTSVGATDDVAALCALGREENLFIHVDAAWAGSAMICPEFRYLWEGVEAADSIVFNPHKWLGAPMECSAHFVREPEKLVKTLAIQPEYLKTYGKEGLVNFSEWSVQLGRRFRALKIWFLLRAYGLDGLRSRIRNHVAWTRELAQKLAAEPDFEITSKPVLALFSFRYTPPGYKGDLDALNRDLVNAINDDGRIYLTQTLHKGEQVIRFTAGPFEMEEEDAHIAFDAICEIARSLAPDKEAL
ncbi:aspartate aminotransferase family protein [Hoeflea sp. TYP-13]|uniref:aspartate aminotransferase family protein n=1 Tax=Hoeflea sp. TYP-13 TaxID=3230023 RepID=UPI0034C6AD5F